MSGPAVEYVFDEYVFDEDGFYEDVVAYALEDEGQDGPRRELRLGPDRAGNLLEIVVLLPDDGEELVILAMRMRPSTGVCCRDRG